MRLNILALSWVLAAPLSLGSDIGPQGADRSAGPPVHIFECEKSQISKLVDDIQQGEGVIRHVYNSSIFWGVSFQMINATRAKEIADMLDKANILKNQWLAQAINLEPANTSDVLRPKEQLDAQNTPKEKRARRTLRLLSNAKKSVDPESPWSHRMTYVDKLHKEGYVGQGIKIAIIDSGVDYTHPALGGCFGTGCRVAMGANLIPHARDKSDPMDYYGHGTKVAGILAGRDAENGFIGVVPNATIHAYRVFSYLTPFAEDTIVAGWLKASEDGAQVIVSGFGLPSSWAQSLSALVVSRIVARGIPCVVALGNDYKGPFNAEAPSTGRGVVAVNSVSRSHDSLTDDCVYRINNGTDIAFSIRAGEPHAWDAEELEVHNIDADYGGSIEDLSYAEGVPGDSGSNCKLMPGDDSEKDLTGRVALIRFPPGYDLDCIYEQRVLNATARGATHVLAWKENVFRLSAPAEAKRIVAMGMTSATVGKTLAGALSAGKTHRRVIIVRTNLWPEIKPNVLAPGEGETSTSRGGGYVGVAGTAFAAPLVAGIYALVGQARGTFDPAILDSVIMGTAEPQSWSHSHHSQNTHDMLSVVQQGSGLIQAWEAAHVTTLVAPASLAFNDTTHRVSSISLHVNNTANSTVQYQLTHVPALTTYTLGQDFITRTAQHIHAPAQIYLSKNAITLGPGESDTISVSASDPEGLDIQRIPLWSGWIAINGSDGTRLTVPYLGLAGSLHGAPVFSSRRADAMIRDGTHLLTIPPDSTVLLRGPPDTPVKHIASSTSYKRPNLIEVQYLLFLGSPEAQVYAVPLSTCLDAETNATALGLDITRSCVPKTSLIQVGDFLTIGQVSTSPYRYVGGGFIPATWDGSLLSGQFAPPGKYKLVCRALSILGDRNVTSDWQISESTEFAIAYEGTNSTDLS